MRLLLVPAKSNAKTSLRGLRLEVMGLFYGAILAGECNAMTSRMLSESELTTERIAAG